MNTKETKRVVAVSAAALISAADLSLASVTTASYTCHGKGGDDRRHGGRPRLPHRHGRLGRARPPVTRGFHHIW